MTPSRFVYSAHALQAMIRRKLTADKVEEAVQSGEVIADYENTSLIRANCF